MLSYTLYEAECSDLRSDLAFISFVSVIVRSEIKDEMCNCFEEKDV